MAKEGERGRRVRIGLGDGIEEVWLREEFRLELSKFEHGGVEVADGFLDWEGDWDMRWNDRGIYMSFIRRLDL